jgi:hypothetical protein
MSVVSSKKKDFFALLSLSSRIDTDEPPLLAYFVMEEGYTTTYGVSRQKKQKNNFFRFFTLK